MVGDLLSYVAMGAGGFVVLGSMIVVTQQQHVKIIQQFGKFKGVRRAGLSFKAPWPIQTATENFSLQIHEIGEDVGVKSKDNAFLSVPIKVQVQVDENKAPLAYFKLKDPEQQVRSYVVNRVRAKGSQMTFEEIFQSSDEFQTDVHAGLRETMAKYGFEIVNVLVDEPQPSEQMREAFDRVLAAERLKEAANAEGQAAKVLAVAKAEAEGDSLRIKGRAYADFRKTVAEGNSEAINLFVGKTGLQAKDAIDFFHNINEMEAVRDAAASGGQIVYVAGSAKDSQASALMGMVAEGTPAKKPAASKKKATSATS